jgi:hypothetical protein
VIKKVSGLETDLNDELRSYQEELIHRKRSTGLDFDAARRSALVEMGGVDQIKELVREQRVGFFGTNDVSRP